MCKCTCEANFAEAAEELRSATAAQRETAQAIKQMERELARTQAALNRMERNVPERVGQALNAAARRGNRGGAA